MKNRIITLTFIFFLLTSFLICQIKKDDLISEKERRRLASKPKISITSLLNGNYFNKLDTYVTDQIPFRDEFKTIKGNTLKKTMFMKENNGIYEKDNILYQIDTKVNVKSIRHLLDKINYIDKTYLTSQNKYFVYIPDKNYYLNDEKIPKIEYNTIEGNLKNGLPSNYKWIDIKNNLDLSSYYRTDIHWSQDKIIGVANNICENMGLSKLESYYTSKEYYPFYGALYSKTVTSIKPDKITYLDSDIIRNTKVYNYEKKGYEKVYKESNLNNIDSYDIFLSGATALLTLENNSNTSGKELIMFRDSFGSSLAPLLIEKYSKITMVDLRYIGSKYLESVLNLSGNEDVLFIYSNVIINNSFTLK